MKSRVWLMVGVIGFAAAGCRYKGGESFLSATTPQPPSEWAGDAGSYGGVAEASGGLQPVTRYSDGAQPTSGQRTDPAINRPAYGSGQRRGEAGVEAAAGHGTTNAPVFQAEPNGSVHGD